MEKAAAKTTPGAEASTRVTEERQRSGSEFHSLFRLQSAIGNQAVLRLMEGRILGAKPALSHKSDSDEQRPRRIAEHVVSTPKLQLKRACDCGGSCSSCQSKSSDFKVSQPNDPTEIEADQIVDKTMRMTEADGRPATSFGSGRNSLYRKFGASGEGDAKIQREALSSGQNIPSQSPAHVQKAISTGGQALDSQTRNFFEPRLGYDLSNVRIHTDSKASQSARAVAAKAYTVGNNIVFGSGEYRPDSEAGKRLVAHELAHIAQSGSSHIRRDTIHRQPDENGELAAIDYEIQMLSQIPLMGPEAAPVMMRLAQLQEQRNRLLGRGGGAYVAPTEPSKPTPPPAKPEPSEDPITIMAGMRQIDLDYMFQVTNNFNSARQLAEPPPAPKPVETGCHTDPYAHHSASTVCGHKRPDEATQATMKAMQTPKPDFTEYEKQQRAKLDRLNAAHLEARRTQTFPANDEFSQYEIALDREVDVLERWKISATEHNIGENDLEVDHYSPLLFRSRYEYSVERRRREKIYDEEVACKSDHGLKWPKLSRKHPDWIDCENRVNAEYYPRGHAQKEAARWRMYVDIQTAMPVLTEGGPVAAFGFHVAHEYLGWSTERSAAFGGALSTATGLGLLKTQQVFANRNVGQSVAPPDEMTPHPDNVASAPARDAVRPPAPVVNKTTSPTTTPPPVKTPPTTTTPPPVKTPPTTTTTPPTVKTPPTTTTTPPTVKTPPTTTTTPPPVKTPPTTTTTPPTVKTPPTTTTTPPTVKAPPTTTTTPPTVKTAPPTTTTPPTVKTPPPTTTTPPTVKTPPPTTTTPPPSKTSYTKTPPPVKTTTNKTGPPANSNAADLAEAERHHEELRLASEKRIATLQQEQAVNQPQIDQLNSQIKANELRANEIRREANFARTNGRTSVKGQKLIDELTTPQDKRLIEDAKRSGFTDARIQEWVLGEKAKEIEAATTNLRLKAQAPATRNAAITIEINKLQGIIAIPDRAGGSYKSVFVHVNDGVSEANHLPAKDSYLGEIRLTTNEGPAIWMTEADHMKTASWGSSDKAVAWRRDQRDLIRQGKFMEAMKMDIEDIRKKFPDGRYEKGIKQALEYASNLGAKLTPNGTTTP